MKITEVMVGVSITKQPQQYESVKAEARITATPEEGGSISEDEKNIIRDEMLDLVSVTYKDMIREFWSKSRER
jgi:hypothetical protein